MPAEDGHPALPKHYRRAAWDEHVDWRDTRALPRAAGRTWQARRTRGRVIAGKAAVDKTVAKWHPLDPLMIATPGSGRFLPVLQVPEYREQAHRGAVRMQRRAAAALTLVTGVLAASAYLGLGANSTRAAWMSLGFAAYVALDYHLVIKRLDVLAERALFSLWIARKAPAHVLGWCAAMLAAGALQWYGESAMGGHEALVLRYGVVADRVMEGEVWRLLIGPFIHAGLAHWLTNLSMLAFVGAVAGPLFKRRSAAVFLLGSSSGALAATLSSSFTGVEAYVGVSAGIFALITCLAGAAWRRPDTLPARFAATASAFALLGVAVGWLASPSTSNTGHLAGALLGLILGSFLPPQACRGRGTA